jgi:hypothetical protein
MPRPAASDCISMQPARPAMSLPPMMKSSGTNTSLPRVGPFMNGDAERIVALADLDAGRRPGSART